MIRLEVFGEAETMASVAQFLDGSDDVDARASRSTRRPGHAVVVAVVRPRAVDGVVDDLRRHSVTDDAVTLTREEVLGRSSGAGAERGSSGRTCSAWRAGTPDRSRGTSHSWSSRASSGATA